MKHEASLLLIIALSVALGVILAQRPCDCAR
jgi:hypothetical protein